ncbi:hypothetical protein FGB62_174g05 [Gracilaria domingensis]|nr:hypothetical protein FGB62_174g05 [Gracilaria domingensis]
MTSENNAFGDLAMSGTHGHSKDNVHEEKEGERCNGGSDEGYGVLAEVEVERIVKMRLVETLDPPAATVVEPVARA